MRKARKAKSRGRYKDNFMVVARDAVAYMTKPSAPVEDVSDLGSFSDFSSAAVDSYNPEIPEDNFITKQDKFHGLPQTYDAFVIFDEDDHEHIHAIVETVKHLESKNISVSKLN